MSHLPAEPVDLAVLGGGPAGLAAAWRAAVTGRRVVLLERAPQPGGLAASFDVDGVRVDHGSHRLHPATPAPILADLRGLLGADLQTRPRNGRLHVAGTWLGFPLRPGEVARALPPAMLARIALDAAAYPLRRTREPTFAATLRRGLGPTLYDALYAPYARKLWGLDGEAISADQAARRVTADTPWKLAARLMSRPRGSGDGQGRVFHYPRRGFGQIPEALADAAAAADADLRLGVEVRGLRTDGPEVEVVTSGGTLRARHAFSTLPLPALAHLADPAPSPAALAASSALTFRAMVLVYLGHRGGRWTGFDAHYFPGAATPVTRISEPANYRVSTLDPDDRSVVCAEIPCHLTDPVWSADDDALAGIVHDALRTHGLPPVAPRGVAVRRVRHVYPVYTLDYAGHLAALTAWADGLDRVTSFGRLGLFAHDNTHHAIAMAYDAVAALRDGDSPDPAAWAAARARFAAHVVED